MRYIEQIQAIVDHSNEYIGPDFTINKRINGTYSITTKDNPVSSFGFMSIEDAIMAAFQDTFYMVIRVSYSPVYSVTFIGLCDYTEYTILQDTSGQDTDIITVPYHKFNVMRDTFDRLLAIKESPDE